MAEDAADSSVRITNREIYNLVLQVKQSVDPLPDQVKDHEVRIRAIEKYMWIWIGAAGILGAGLGQIINTIINK